MTIAGARLVPARPPGAVAERGPESLGATRALSLRSGRKNEARGHAILESNGLLG